MAPDQKPQSAWLLYADPDFDRSPPGHITAGPPQLMGLSLMAPLLFGARDPRRPRGLLLF